MRRSADRRVCVFRIGRHQRADWAAGVPFAAASQYVGSAFKLFSVFQKSESGASREMATFSSGRTALPSHEPPGVRPSSGAAGSEVGVGLEILFPRESTAVAAPADGRTPVHGRKACPSSGKGSPHEPEHLLSPSLSSLLNGGENPPDFMRALRPVTPNAQVVDYQRSHFEVTGQGGRRPGEEAHRGSGVQSANFVSGNSHPARSRWEREQRAHRCRLAGAHAASTSPGHRWRAR